MSHVIQNPLSRVGILGVLLTMGICLAGCNRGPDISTPKKAATAFATAMQAGDMDTMKKTSAGTDAQYANLQKMSDLAQAAGRYHKSIVAKFGETATKGEMFDMSQVAKSLDDADEKIDGDNATVTPKSQSGFASGIKLKKDSGGWKVDLGEIDKAGMNFDKTAKPMGDAFDATAKEVDDGKFKSSDEAMMALGKRVMGAQLGQ